MSADADRRVRASREDDSGSAADSPFLNERVLVLVFEFMRWDVRTLCLASSVNRKLRAIAKRLLWRELCVYRAPGMTTALTAGSTNGRRISGGWAALAKLLFFCCGCEPTRNFRGSQRLSGHFALSSRFSKTSGRSFLTTKCRGDLLFVCDPCEHRKMASKKGGHGGDDDKAEAVAGAEEEQEEDIVGVYRGVFKEFSGSRTREFLVRRQVALEDRVCPYCGARVWSMTSARLVPRSAARRLGSRDGRLEYFVCIHGHLHGTCWLIPLSSSSSDEEEGEDEDADADGSEAGYRDGSASSTGEEIVADGPAE
ncbi:hypothetical protein MLD38_031802 [Melastoma candidum]|uniref:Uncharacterized protein n=1 Tax=Melastoma candidum TaxID=119954 RepID=A0ACB9MRY8_9MYRT|nr:hypothetical protein MLD38_031802 [Melastoma candidum]